jgi:predicted phage terminase large subunit-like protein
MVKASGGSIVAVTAIVLPDSFMDTLQSWDCAFKDLKSSDYVVGQVWARKSADKFLLDQVRGQMDCPTTIDAIRKLSAKWPRARTKLIEDKANGSAVIQVLRHELAGMIAVQPAGGKVARASAVCPQIESGNIYLPHPAMAPWIEAFIEECAAFPHARHDDQVDAMSQALLRFACGPKVRISSV